jgi:predicted nuclease of predicted toxin-antitoxin system
MPWRKLTGSTEVPPDFKAKVPILVDESLGRAVADHLREDGFNVVFSHDVGLAGKDDSDVAAYAWREGRMIWTHDKDFLDDNVLPEHRNPGVVVLPGGAGNQRAMVVGLTVAMRIFGHGKKAWMKTKTEITPSGELTIRRRRDDGRMTSTRYRGIIGRNDLEEWQDE